MSNTNDLLSVAQTARLLGKSQTTVLRLIASGTLPASKLGPGTAAYVIARTDVDALTEAIAS